MRTGGAGELFARAGSEERLLELLAWAAADGVAVSVVGSGSNLLVADEGVSGLVVKLDGELAAISVDGQRMLCGGGARLPAVAARAAREGLSGIEFGVNIPGTVGGAVRMNANAYGGELQRVLEWVRIATASGIERREPSELGLGYRRSSLAEGEIVDEREPAAVPGGAGCGEGDARGDARAAATRPSRRASRRSARRSRTPTGGRGHLSRVAARGCCCRRPAATA